MHICVIGGLGQVGLVTSAGLAELGHSVVVVDSDRERLALVQDGRLPFLEPGLSRLLERYCTAERLRFASSLAEGARGARMVFIAVATPARPDGETDLSQVIAAAEELAGVLEDRVIIAIRSTVPPDTSQTVRRILEAHDRFEGRDFDLVALPEFLSGGTAMHDFLHPARVVIGAIDPLVRSEVRALFRELDVPVIETSFEHAMLIKYASNAFLAMRVSFANELASVCDAAGADVNEVLSGLGYDPRIGHSYLAPGIGFGGPCLEKDLLSLIRFTESVGYEPAFLRAILDRNHHQIRQILQRVNELLGGDMFARTIAVLGLAFKPETSDIRNSLSVRIIDRLQRRGAVIHAYDPMAQGEVQQAMPRILFFDAPYAAAQGSHLVLLLTGWEEFRHLDLERLRLAVALPNIVDGVNILDPMAAKRAGFIYQGVGRN